MKSSLVKYLLIALFFHGNIGCKKVCYGGTCIHTKNCIDYYIHHGDMSFTEKSQFLVLYALVHYINDFLDPSTYTLNYCTVDDAYLIVNQLGLGTLLSL